MRLREKLTVEEKIAIALELIKRERSLDEIRQHYRVSHTTAYKLRNLFLEGGRRALGRRDRYDPRDLEARVRVIEERLAGDGHARRAAHMRASPPPRAAGGAGLSGKTG